MKYRFYFILFISIGLFLTSGCDKQDDEVSDIQIRFMQPTQGAVIANPSNVQIRIIVEAEPENHDIEIVLYPHNDSNNKIIDWDTHTHDEVIEFNQTVDLSSFPSGTIFHLDVEACRDEGCEHKVTGGIEFSIQ